MTIDHYILYKAKTNSYTFRLQYVYTFIFLLFYISPHFYWMPNPMMSQRYFIFRDHDNWKSSVTGLTPALALTGCRRPPTTCSPSQNGIISPEKYVSKMFPQIPTHGNFCNFALFSIELSLGWNPSSTTTRSWSSSTGRSLSMIHQR